MKFKALQRLSEPWLTTSSTYEHIKSVISSADEQAEFSIAENQELETANGIAMVSLKGLMVKNPSPLEQVFLGAVCTESFTNQIESLIDNNSVQGVLLDMDSGGGSVQGVIEASEAVSRLAKQKPIVAFTDGMIASACYWVASQATDIIASPSARVGSIGVYLPVADHSAQYAKEGIKVEVIKNEDGKHKGVGVEGTAITDDQRAQMQSEVEEIYAEFKGAVLSNRSVKAEAMQGQAFMAKSAVEKGLVDAIGSFQDAFMLLEMAIKKQHGLTKNL